ncbi:MAG: 6-phosphogluconolactonase [Acidobacteriia bacterium]|nr:6-phosphogluconolactonase [Terriglobia bacterium]
MSELELKIYPDPKSLFRAAAEAVTQVLQAGLREHPKLTFVLAGGTTPRGVYELLGTSCAFQNWSAVEFFWGDERCVPPDNEASNFRMARESLLSRLSLPDRNIHRIPAELENSEDAARLYEEEILKSFAAPGLPSFDLVLLGMGDDGHTASLFPGTRWDESRLVIANHSPHPPFRRISMTPRLLNAARRVIFLAAGQAKAHALKRVLEDPACDYPARRIKPAEGALTWMVDSAAASLLRQEP